MEQPTKTLSKWRFELQSIGKKHWPVFYKEILGVPASSYPRLFKALNNYGFWPLFMAITESADRELNGDPLNYVIAVAKNKWIESEQEHENDEEYTKELEAAKEKSRKDNEELAKKLNRLEKKRT